MADIAKAAIVSKENQNGLLVEETIKNSPSDDSNSLTECSVANYTNNCSNQNAYTETKEGGYQEIDSFSELSFKTTDEISLQDIIESEFAARISNINGDECAAKTEDSWDTSDMNKSHDPFDDLFEDYNEKDLKSPDCVPVAHEKDLLSVEANDNLKNQVVSNLDDFISGPMQGDTSLITDYLEEYAEEEKEQIEINNKKSTKSVNIFKLDRPEEIPILTNFDPFTAIEEDSECSNPLANSNVLNSPDEFQFPESPVESQSLQSASPIVIIEKTKIYDENIPLNKSNDVMRELFTKTISDENLEDLTEQNYEQNDEDQSKFHVADSMASVTDSLPNVSSLLSPDKIEVDEFFSSEDIFITNEEGKERKVNEGDCAKKNSENLEAKEISSPGNIELFIDDEDLDNFSSQKSHEEQTNQENPDLVNAMFSCEEENKWTTVEEVLKAQPENFELEGDQCLANATNNFAKPNNVVEIYINDASQATTLQVNGLSESDSGVSISSFYFKKKKKKLSVYLHKN